MSPQNPSRNAGSPVYAATIGAEDLDRSIALYTDTIGFDVIARERMSGAAFEAHWSVPTGSAADVAVLADRCEIGRIVLMQWDAPDRQLIRDSDAQLVYGFINLNFYSNDIHAHTRRIEEAGYRPWTEPVEHHMGWDIGEPIEVMIDGHMWPPLSQSRRGCQPGGIYEMGAFSSFISQIHKRRLLWEVLMEP